MVLTVPKTGPKITKNFLLSKNSEETYMSTYLGVPVKKGLLISPLRNDKRPTASFYRNKKGELIFHDFGIDFSGNFIDIVMYKNGCDYFKALQIIAEDFGFIPKTEVRNPVKVRTTEVKIQEKADTAIQIEMQPFTEKELEWWKSFGVTSTTLKKFKVFSCKNVFLNGQYFASNSESSYIFGYYGGTKAKNELWRIYFPQKRVYRFLSNWDKNIIQGAKQLPTTGDLLVITKSLKDVMCLYELGVNAIAPCSEVLFLTDLQLDKLKQRFKNIVVFYDNDLPGIQGMRRIKAKHPELKYFWIPRGYNAKDVSDFVKKYGKEKTQKYVSQIKENFKIC